MTEDSVHGFFVNLLAAMERQLGALKHLHLTAAAGYGLGPAVMAIEHHLTEARARFGEMTDQPVPVDVAAEVPEAVAEKEVPDGAAGAQRPEHSEDGIAPK